MSGYSLPIDFNNIALTTSPPTSIRAETPDNKPRELLLKWDAVTGSPAADSYVVKYRQPTQDSYTTVATTSTTSHNLTLLSELSPYKEFQFQVQGVNNNFEGLASEPLTVRMKPQMPNPAVITGTESGLSSSQLIVTFDPKWNLTNGVAKEFEIFLREVTSAKKRISHQTNIKATAGSAMSSILIDGLKPGTNYDLQAQSVNEDGEKSDLSSAITRRTSEGFPGIYFTVTRALRFNKARAT